MGSIPFGFGAYDSVQPFALAIAFQAQKCFARLIEEVDVWDRDISACRWAFQTGETSDAELPPGQEARRFLGSLPGLKWVKGCFALKKDDEISERDFTGGRGSTNVSTWFKQVQFALPSARRRLIAFGLKHFPIDIVRAVAAVPSGQCLVVEAFSVALSQEPISWSIWSEIFASRGAVLCKICERSARPLCSKS
jgi:hypothetical protein